MKKATKIDVAFWSTVILSNVSDTLWIGIAWLIMAAILLVLKLTD